jgi:hypothetical protein
MFVEHTQRDFRSFLRLYLQTVNKRIVFLIVNYINVLKTDLVSTVNCKGRFLSRSPSLAISIDAGLLFIK